MYKISYLEEKYWRQRKAYHSVGFFWHRWEASCMCQVSILHWFSLTGVSVLFCGNSQLANFLPKRQCFFKKRHIWTLISTNRTHVMVSFVLQRHKCSVHCSTQKGKGLCAEKNTDEGIKDKFLLFILLIQFAGSFWRRLVLCHRVFPTLQVLWRLHHLCGCLIKTQTSLTNSTLVKSLYGNPFWNFHE